MKMKRNKKKTKEEEKHLEKDERKTAKEDKQARDDITQETTETSFDSKFTTNVNAEGTILQRRANNTETDSDSVNSERRQKCKQMEEDKVRASENTEDFPPLTQTPGEEEGQSTPRPLLSRLTETEEKVVKGLLELCAHASSNPKLKALTATILEETLKLKALCFEAVKENAQLNGKVDGLKEALSLNSSARDDGYRRAVAKEEREDKPPPELQRKGEQPTEALIITSETLKPAEIQRALCSKVDPCHMGLRDVNVRQNSSGVVVTSTSRDGLKKLHQKINNDTEMRELKAREPKKKLPELKIVESIKT